MTALEGLWYAGATGPVADPVFGLDDIVIAHQGPSKRPGHKEGD